MFWRQRKWNVFCSYGIMLYWICCQFIWLMKFKGYCIFRYKSDLKTQVYNTSKKGFALWIFGDGNVIIKN